MDNNNHLLEENNEQPTQQENQEEYVGNIWGWNFSLVGLAIIILLGAFMVYRHKTMNVPMNGWNPAQEQSATPPADSTGH